VAAVIPDPKRIHAFETPKALESWLRKHHSSEPELWLKVHKKDSGLRSVTCAEALDVMLCWGWIDGLRKSLDGQSFLQRYSPRRAKSLWSQINREHVARLTKAGRMTVHGQKQIDAAKADGRWNAAYAPIRAASADSIPEDLRAAIEANARALKTFGTLKRVNLFALAFRTNNMKTPAGRAKKIAELVAMLARGTTVVPQKTTRKTLRKKVTKPRKQAKRGAKD
jgi:uncharacterized protein YdeI (YjbR/CyaY-like superfamily)